MGEGKENETAPASARPAVGVVGAGTMGAGVAQCFAQAGHPVTVVDPDAEARRGGAERLRAGVRLAKLIRGREKGGERQETAVADPVRLVEFTAEADALAHVSYVVECAREREPLKAGIFRALDAVCPPGTVFASCTSAIPVARLGSFTDRPDRVIGTHFMNPAPLKDAVEVARSPHTSDETVDRTLALLAGIGKKPIVVGDGPGFVTNRVLMLTVNEAAYVLHEGTADAETVDQVFQECFGHPMGPLRTGDLIGLDTVADTLGVLRDHTGDERFTPCPLLAKLVAEGATGRKAGRGFHTYPSGASTRAAGATGPSGTTGSTRPLVPRGESHG